MTYKASGILMRMPVRKTDDRSQIARERELIKKLARTHGKSRTEIAKITGKSPHAIGMHLAADEFSKAEVISLQALIHRHGIQAVRERIDKIGGRGPAHHAR